MIINRGNVRDVQLNVEMFWSYSRGKVLFITKQDYSFKLSSGQVITIPAGYLTDFRTCPNPREMRGFWRKAAALAGKWAVEIVVPQIGRHNIATLIHDYLYTHLNGVYTQEFADQEMDYWNGACEVPLWQAALMLAGVELAGEYWWDDHNLKHEKKHA